MTPDFRLLAESDADLFWTLRLEALELEPRSFGQSADEHRVLPKEAFAARLRASSASRDFVLGAFAGPQLIGTAGFYRLRNDKEFHRGQGVGRQLLSELLRIARAQDGVELINLAVGTLVVLSD